MSSFTNTLAGLPAGWDYRLVSNEEQDRFHALIGELLAAEIIEGLIATHDIDRAISAGRAQQCLTWIPRAREQLREMIAAAAYVAQQNEDEIVLAVKKTTAAAEKTEAAYTKAAEAHQRATREKDQAAATERKLRDAQAHMATGDTVLQQAWQKLQQLRSEAP